MTDLSSQPDRLIVCSPGTTSVVWEGRRATVGDVKKAVQFSRNAFQSWRRSTAEQRIEIALRFAQCATDAQDRIARQISLETGKPTWEAISEAKLVPAKVRLAIDAFNSRSASQRIDLPQGIGGVSYQGIGVMAVLGPFNFPAHLPNGHIVPALIAGNSVLFKPSELAAGTGEILCDLWADAGLPDGVLQVVHGDGKVGAEIVSNDVDGVLFTGSYSAGCSIHRSLGGRPNVLLALEMGGNNPLVIHNVSNLDAAAYLTVLSAFVTAGQRCTCARRLILPDGPNVAPLIDRIVGLCKGMRVGLPDDHPDPFMGPLISTTAAQRVLEAQADLIRRNAIPIVRSEQIGTNPALIGPAVIDVTDLPQRSDDEVFGPLLQVIRVSDFESALAEANATQYGLSASLLSDDEALFHTFRDNVRAGVVNWNQPTIGASGRLPFGGLGASGNHRPSGYFAADYCSDAAATLESASLSLPKTILPGIKLDL